MAERDSSRSQLESSFQQQRGAATFSITTFSTMTLSIKGLFVIFSKKDTQHNKRSIISSVFMLSVVALSVIRLIVVMLNVVAPAKMSALFIYFVQ